MFQPLGRLTQQKGVRRLDETDVRHFVQTWLRTHLKLDHVNCEGYRAGVVTVRSASPAVRAAVKVLEFDLGRALKQECEQNLQRIIIRA